MEGLNLGNASYKWKNIYYTGALNGGSDEYIKDDIKSINTISSIDKFYMSLNPIQYKFKQFLIQTMMKYLKYISDLEQGKQKGI